MIEDYFKIAFRNLKERKIRSLLTVLGIFLAILTIFVLLSISFGLSDFVNEQFEMLGTDKFFIQPRGQLGAPGTGGAVELTLDDVEVVDKVKGVELSAYISVGNGKIEYKDQTRYYMVMGIPTDDEIMDLIFEASDLDIEDGRFIKDTDQKKIVLGYNYKYRNLFKKSVKPGDIIEINDVEYEVIGILESVGNPQDDQQVYMSFEDFQDLFDSGDRVDVIWTQVKLGEDINEVADRVERKLMKYRDVDEKTIDFTISTPEELLATFGNILNILTVFLVGIGAISVIVGGIGIANTMYTSVLERQKEIGTMKAIGAKNSNILLIFIIESGVLGLFGAILGVGVGAGIAKFIEFIGRVLIGSEMLRASMNPILIGGCLGFGFLIGVLSGVLPSWQASRLKPVDALRYE